MKKVLFVSLIFLILSFTLVAAQDDDPNDTTDDNWCYEGNPWGDGRCNDPDEYINEYNWVSGWCHAQVENGNYVGTFYECMDITEIPEIPEPENIRVAVDDTYFVDCEPFFNVDVPGVLKNDIGDNLTVISSSTGGNPDILLLDMSAAGNFDIGFAEPGTFTFTYTITGGSEATVTLYNLCS